MAGEDYDVNVLRLDSLAGKAGCFGDCSLGPQRSPLCFETEALEQSKRINTFSM